MAVLQALECKTIDGITIRGQLYAVHGPAPVIIMTLGFNVVKEFILPETVRGFQRMGFNAVNYNPRNTWTSDGLPRNEIDPLKKVEDLSDIITHISALPSVDPEQIVLWGFSFGATISGCATALDRRVEAVVMVCPLFRFFKPDKMEEALPRLIAERQSQLAGRPPQTMQFFTVDGDNITGTGESRADSPGGKQAFRLATVLVARGGPNLIRADSVTLQKYYRLAIFCPRAILRLLDKTLVLMIIPENDLMSPP